MKDTIQKKIQALYTARAAGNMARVKELRTEVATLFSAAGDENLTDESKELARFDAEMQLAGYNADRQNPTATSGRDTGNPPAGGGYAPDVLVNAGGGSSAAGDEDEDGENKESKSEEDEDEDKKDEDDEKLSSDELKAIKAELKARRDAEQAKATADAIEAAIQQARTSHTGLAALADEARTHVIAAVRRYAQKPEDVMKLVTDEVESVGKLLATERLQQTGASNGVGSEPRARVTREARPWMQHVEAINAAADDIRRMQDGFDPNSVENRQRRQFNMESFVLPLIEENAQRHGNARSAADLFARGDEFFAAGDSRAVEGLRAASDATISSFLNQPTISTALLIQQFQDMTALAFVGAIGPGIDNGVTGGWSPTGNSGDGRVGSVLRVPVEYYTAPTGYGAIGNPDFDAGLLVPEDTGIPEGSVNIAWLPFAPQFRRIATSITSEIVRMLGNGPLNYPAVARMLYHIAQDKSRRIDRALFAEMFNISDEYLAVAVAAESVSLANNSIFNTAPISVNLNPTKTAVAAIAATDPSVTYGTGVVAAVRVKGRGNGTSSPYFGTTNGYDPIVQPRTVVDLDAAGNITTTVKNPITISGQVRGYLDDNGSIQNIPGGGTATYAVDFQNGVIVFNAGAGLAGTGGVLTSAVTIAAYSYATNFDNFIVNNPTLPTGVTVEQYMNGLLSQSDRTAALMGSSPRFMSPNVAIASLNAATYLTQATNFAPLMAPRGTELYPTPEFFAARNGVMFARHNTPWPGRDKRILYTRRGSTKYAIDTPFMLDGPHPTYDSSGLVKAKKVYYGEELSVIATPQVTNAAGTVLNPNSRTIILR